MGEAAYAIGEPAKREIALLSNKENRKNRSGPVALHLDSIGVAATAACVGEPSRASFHDLPLMHGKGVRQSGVVQTAGARCPGESARAVGIRDKQTEISRYSRSAARGAGDGGLGHRRNRRKGGGRATGGGVLERESIRMNEIRGDLQVHRPCGRAEA